MKDFDRHVVLPLLKISKMCVTDIHKHEELTEEAKSDIREIKKEFDKTYNEIMGEE